MKYTVLFHFFASFIYLYLAAYVLYKNPRALLNRICVFLVLCLAIWVFSMGLLGDANAPKETAILSGYIGSIGWTSFASFFLLFMLAFTKKDKILGKRFIYYFIFLPSLFFLYKQWTGFLIIDYLWQPHGWIPKFADSILPNLYYAYSFLFYAFGLYLCLDFKRKTRVLREKKQANIIFITTLISFSIGSITDFLLPILNIYRIPMTTGFFILIWAGGLIYAIIRYGLMTITPATAADNILATMGDSLILADPEGRIMTVNPATLDLLGYKESGLVGKPITTILTEDEYTQRSKELMQKQRIRDYDANYHSSSGAEIPVSLFMSLLRNRMKELTGIVCIAKDMREIKRLMEKEKELAAAEKKRALELESAYQELRKTQEQLVQSAKMAAVGQLGAGVAHELNNPLGGILGYAQLILSKLQKAEFVQDDFSACQKYIESIERESTRCKKIVENLLKFSRRPLSAQPEPLDIGKTIEETISITGHQLKVKSVKLTTDIQPNLAKVMGVVNQLQQVFTNLILNAQQAMRDGGGIKITAGNIIDDRTRETTRVKIEFADTGCGIPEEIISRIFEPFFTTKTKEKGTGLGLSVSYQIIQDHKGTLDAKSQVGKGSVFTITLPAQKD